MAQYTPPTDEQLHFRVTEDQLPSFKPLLKPFGALTLSSTSLASERRGSEKLDSFAELQDVTSASVAANSFTAETMKNLLSNPVHSSILTPVNRIIDGNEDERLYTDNSIIGLSTAIAREIYNSARAQEAARILRQSFEQLQLRPLRDAQQSLVSASNSTTLNEESSMPQPRITVVNKQDFAPLESSQEAGHNGVFKIHNIRILQQGTPEFVQQSSQKPPIAQSLEPLEKSLEFEGTELSKVTEARAYEDDKRVQRITAHSALNPTAKVLPYPRFVLNPAEYDSHQTSSEELQHGSALLQSEYPQTQSRPTAAVPVLKSDLISKASAKNMSPLYPTGKTIFSAITTDYDPQHKLPSTYEAAQERADLQNVRSPGAAPFAMSTALATQWTEKLAAVAAASPGNFETMKQSLPPFLSAENQNDVAVPYNEGHRHVHEEFVGDSGLLHTRSPHLHLTHLTSSNADMQLFSSASEKTVKYGNFGGGRAPDMSYEASFGVHRHRRGTT
uniref:Uncharacterized protein n=1 Tax=Parascaris univalens TaxID=6257 RepID=A0A914ZEY9_PARUN